MPGKEPNNFRLGLRGKLLLATFLPAQIPLLTALVSFRLGESRFDLILTILLCEFAGCLFAALLISEVIRPLGRARRRLRALVNAHELLPPELRRADDESIILSLDRSILELREAGLIDALTGVGNRRACEQKLRQDLARASRAGTPYSVAFFDLDQLKEINDTYGHQAGDWCLVCVAEAIEEHIRDGDWVARWGGDEFVLALWNADRQRAEAICDRVLSAIRCKPEPHSQIKYEVTASVGIAEFEVGQSSSTLLNHADEALLHSKRGGRNKLSVFEWR